VSIEVSNESGAAVDEAALVDLARHVLDEMGVNPLAELSLLLVDEDYMTSLHERWMDEPGPTDVLSFPMDELDTARGPDDDSDGATALLGDVVLCPSVAAQQAELAQHSTADELALLTTHGILHLLGYDHAESADERRMFTLQNRLLQTWRERGRRPGADPAGTGADAEPASGGPPAAPASETSGGDPADAAADAASAEPAAAPSASSDSGGSRTTVRATTRCPGPGERLRHRDADRRSGPGAAGRLLCRGRLRDPAGVARAGG
jgi:probable rRNA maturation factor